jgi:hypothetical protein
VNSGDTILVIANCQTTTANVSTGLGSFSDNATGGSNTYLPAIGTAGWYVANAGDSSIAFWAGYCQSAKATQSLTVSANFTSGAKTVTFDLIFVAVYRGLGTFDIVGAMASQQSPGTGANAITSGTASVTSGDTVIGMIVDWDNTGTAAGTGFTRDFIDGTATYSAESLTQGSTTTRGATATASGASGKFDIIMMAFKSAAVAVPWGFDADAGGSRAAHRIGWRARPQILLDDPSGFPFTAVKTGTAYYEEEIRRRQLPVRWHASPQPDVTDGFPFTAAASIVPPWAFDDGRSPPRIAARRVPLQEDLIQGQASVPWWFEEEPRRLTRRTASRPHLEPLLGFGYPVARTPGVYYEEEQHTFQRNRPQRPARAERSRDLEGLLLLLSIIADQRAVIEWYAFMAIDCPPLAEALAGSKTDSIAIQEIVALGRNDGGLVDESLLTVRMDPSVEAEALASSRSDPPVNQEATADSRFDVSNVRSEFQARVAGDASILFEALAQLRGDSSVQIEWTSSTLVVLADAFIALEFLAATVGDRGFWSEWLSFDSTDIVARSEFVAAVLGGRGNLILEALASASGEGFARAEFFGGIRADPPAQAEYGSSSAASARLWDEFLTRVIGDATAISEALSRQLSDPSAQAEFTANSFRSSGILAELIASAVARGGTPLEELSSRRADAAVQAEAAAQIAGDMAALAEAVAATFADSRLATEFISLVKVIVSDVLIPLEFGGAGGFLLPAGTTTGFISNLSSFMNRRH